MSKILIVDDDTDVLVITKSLLANKGFDVETDDNWKDALEKISSFKPQVIVLDVFLNDIDGLDICRQLKSMKHTKDISILIFSSFPRIAENAIYEYGADDFIGKPFEVDELIVKLHSLLSKKAGMASVCYSGIQIFFSYHFYMMMHMTDSDKANTVNR